MEDFLPTLEALGKFGLGGVAIYFLYKFSMWAGEKFFATVAMMTNSNKVAADNFLQALDKFSQDSASRNENNVKAFKESLEQIRKQALDDRERQQKRDAELQQSIETMRQNHACRFNG